MDLDNFTVAGRAHHQIIVHNRYVIERGNRAGVQQYRNVSGARIRCGQVKVPVAIQIGGENRARPISHPIVHSTGKSTVTGVQQHRNVRGIAIRGGQVRVPVAIQIGGEN